MRIVHIIHSLGSTMSNYTTPNYLCLDEISKFLYKFNIWR